MTILLFFIVLAVLILSHEFGHFITAKKAGIRVDEFGFGFPPRIAKFKKGETTYSLNLIPFGGFVKIHGEEGQEAADPRSFASKSIGVRSLIISAGVIFNVLLAWILIIGGFSFGMPTSVSSAPEGVEVRDKKVVILQIGKDSPAEKAGLLPGDRILGYENVDAVKEAIESRLGQAMTLNYQRGEENLTAELVPRENPPPGEGAIGIAMDEVGTVRLPVHRAIWEGSIMTYHVVVGTAVGIYNFIAGAIAGEVGLSAITGPVGIAGIVGSAADFGFVYFLSFMAFLSINLAIINIVPFPALDGGRLLFLLIEKIKGTPVSARISSIVHGAGMALLLLLMLLVTYKDIVKLIS
ncbi:RIP metalloprotease RseP [Candidatus Parcubacteria bacterium]|nr:MAG: RIP metalloprotease RseP [Candidatus Parcubacteria bacterium]